jgi:hypothetical protein
MLGINRGERLRALANRRPSQHLIAGGHMVNGRNDGTKVYSSGTQFTDNLAAEW